MFQRGTSDQRLRLIGPRERREQSRRRSSSEWIAIDFETANEKRSSACALGVAVVRDGQVVSHASSLIRPPEMRFDPINIGIHGITPEDVADAPNFRELWEGIASFFADRVIVAHNASFDISVLRHSLDAYAIPHPNVLYFCTVQLARRVWPHLPNFRLDTVASYLRISFRHHRADQDALACAQVSLACCRARRVSHLKALGRELGISGRRPIP